MKPTRSSVDDNANHGNSAAADSGNFRFPEMPIRSQKCLICEKSFQNIRDVALVRRVKDTRPLEKCYRHVSCLWSASGDETFVLLPCLPALMAAESFPSFAKRMKARGKVICGLQEFTQTGLSHVLGVMASAAVTKSLEEGFAGVMVNALTSFAENHVGNEERLRELERENAILRKKVLDLGGKLPFQVDLPAPPAVRSTPRLSAPQHLGNEESFFIPSGMLPHRPLNSSVPSAPSVAAIPSDQSMVTSVTPRGLRTSTTG